MPGGFSWWFDAPGLVAVTLTGFKLWQVTLRSRMPVAHAALNMGDQRTAIVRLVHSQLRRRLWRPLFGLLGLGCVAGMLTQPTDWWSVFILAILSVVAALLWDEADCRDARLECRRLGIADPDRIIAQSSAPERGSPGARP